MDRYIILRDENTALRRGQPFGVPGAGAEPFSRGMASTIPPDPVFETAEMHSAEARSLEHDPGVLHVARAMPTRLVAPVASATPGPGVGDGPTWGVVRTGAADSPFDGVGVKVAVLDTGIDAAHPAFRGVQLEQRDFSGDGDGDPNGHGTHCAGTIFGRDVEGTRIGVAPGVGTALIGKVLGDDGSGSSEMLFDALKWASSNRVRVVSMSLGFDFPGFAERLVAEEGMPVILATSIALEAYRMNLRMFDRIMDLFRAQAAFDGGVVVVAASGNESARETNPDFEVSASVPAAAEGVISVGAVSEASGVLSVAPFSNTNPVLSAPGVNVVSAATGGGLVALNGTSMACPHVAGVAALWWQALAGAGVPLTSRAVEARMLASATRDGFVDGTDIADRGQGLVQAPSAALA
ncbi:S8 family serine peptidase [Boseongicola sp. H5]|uniref:S8 family peptidase n=1 Tax=Boseongicola sp. H5 TaxID=2763261 RepID=UPI001D0A1472|nr:S8 family serine peptidase [Boseongicola sp. H5]